MRDAAGWRGGEGGKRKAGGRSWEVKRGRSLTRPGPERAIRVGRANLSRQCCFAGEPVQIKTSQHRAPSAVQKPPTTLRIGERRSESVCWPVESASGPSTVRELGPVGPGS